MSRTFSRLVALASGLPLLALVASPRAFAGVNVYFVGSDEACPFSTIQDAVDAAAAHPGPDFVWLAMNASFSGQHVHVSDTERVVIEGGFVDCTDNDIDTALTTVSGAGNDGGAVFEVHGASTSDIYFKNVFITGADRSGDAQGGGIDFYGAGKLTLEQSSVSINSAGYGGGINANGDGGHVDVVLEDNSLVLNNTAQTSGGGIRVEGDTRLYALQPQTLIGFNHAQNGYGGGIEVLSPARADLGSPGYNGGAVIQNNDAQYGGGIAVLGISNPDNRGAVARLFTTDAANPLQLSDNTASARGGAIYLKPYTQHVPSESAGASACAFDYRINDNIAADGAAVYADFDSDVSGRNVGSDFSLNQTDPCGPEAPPALGAVACAPGVACNEMARNIAEDSNNQPTDGAVVTIDSTSSFRANRFILRGNTAAYAINVVGADESHYGTSNLANCLVANNHTQHELVGIRRTEATTFSIGRCTLANNTIDNGYALYANENTTFSLTGSIIDMPGVQTLDYLGTDLNVGYVLSNDTSTLGPGVGILNGEATFVDATNSDYHLQPSSLGVDFAPAAGGIDLDRKPRDVDLPTVPNADGPRDLGAYEIQLDTVLACADADTIFCDGFEMP